MANPDTAAPEGALSPASPARRFRYVDVLHNLVVIGGLVGGGMSLGYYFGVQSTREDALAEIERLQYTHSEALSVLARATGRAASKAELAADQVGAAAEAVGEVTAKVDAAAKTASLAASTAATAAKSTGAAVAPVNRAIREANEQLQGVRR